MFPDQPNVNCPACGLSGSEHVFDQDTGETVCGRCAAVVDAPDQSAAEVGIAGLNTPTPRQELGGYVGSATGMPRDATGKTIDDVYAMRRQRKWQHRTASQAAGPESIRMGDLMIRTLADKLSLPDNVRLDAAAICRRACKEGLARGRTVGAVAAASMMLAIRISGIPKTATEVEEAANIRRLPTHYRMLCKNLGMYAPPPNLNTHITRIASTLGLTAAVTGRAVTILDDATNRGLTGGRSPKVVAAAVVALASKVVKNDVSMEAVAKAAGVSAPGVRQCVATLRRDCDATIL